MLNSIIVGRLNSLYIALSKKDGSKIDSPLEVLQDARTQMLKHGTDLQIEIYNQYIRLIALHVPVPAALRIENADVETKSLVTKTNTELGGIPFENEAGISVVTCSMNRTENLIKAIFSWIAHPEISEILIVDWNSEFPVAKSLLSANIDDPRIRIVRMENEPRWILSYAFNIGFRSAKYSTILKADADIVLSQDFFSRNGILKGSFIAGNWRKPKGSKLL